MAYTRLEKWIIGLALLGALLAAYALSLHYQTGASAICDISETFSCDKVNKSQWSELFGIPVALLGLLAYLVLAVLVVKQKSVRRILSFTERDFWQYILALIIVMLAFQMYLTYVEIFMLRAYCLICLGTQAIILVLVTLAAVIRGRL